ISARHCELELRDGYWFVRDLKSSNGTRVNGAPCTEQWLLPGDVLAVAGYRLHVVYDPPADRPQPQHLAPEARLPPTPAPPSHSPKPAATAAPPSTSGLLGELLPCGGGDPIQLRKTKLVLGRRPECDVTVPVGVVSGQHCELEYRDSH